MYKGSGGMDDRRFFLVIRSYYVAGKIVEKDFSAEFLNCNKLF